MLALTFKTNDVARAKRVPPSGFEKAVEFLIGAQERT